MASISVGLAEVKFSRTPGDIIVAHGLGSCVGVAIYDKINKLAGMIHIVLPDNAIQKGNISPERFANSGIPILIEKYKILGGNLFSSIIKIAGGSNMFKQQTQSTVLDIGARNVEAVLAALKLENIVPHSKDVGGTNGRTFSIYVETGRITSRMIGMQERDI